jgi:DNA primase
VVASSGTSLTEGQLQIIKRFCSTVTFLYDGDEAGQKAAIRGLSLALDQDLNVKIVPLQDNQDPDSLIREIGASAFSSLISDNARDFLIYRARNIQKKYSDLPIEKSQETRELISDLSFVKDPMKRSIYVKEISSILQINEKSLLGELNKQIRKNIANKKRNFSSQSTPPNKTSDEESFLSNKPLTGSQRNIIQDDYFQEKEIIRILLQDGHKMIGDNESFTVANFIMHNLKDVDNTFKNEVFRSIMNEYSSLIDSDSEIKMDYFINHKDEQIRQIALEFAAPPYEYANWSGFGVELQTQKTIEENFERDSMQAVLRFKLKKLNKQIEEVFNRIKSDSTDPTEKETLIIIYNKILTHRKKLADELGTIVL